MNSVGRKKSTPKAAAAAPSSTSSRKRRSKHQNGGVSKRNVSLSEAELRLSNNTHHGGVDNSKEINSTRSNQNYKNDYGLDPLSKLSKNYEIPHNNINNNVSKSPSINEENDINVRASPPCTRRKKNPLLQSPNPSNDTSTPAHHPGKGNRLDIHSYINLSAREKSNLHDIVPTIMNHARGNRVLPIIKKVINYGMDLEQFTRGPDGESDQERDKRFHDNQERAANGRIEGNNLRVEIYDVIKLLLGDEFANRVNIDQFLKDFMGYMIKHFGTQNENGRGTDYINCHSNSGCLNVIAKRMPNYCLSEMIDASFEEGESYVDIVKTRDDSSTTWAQPNAVFPENASQYDKVINFLRSDEKSIRIMFGKRSHASNWRNKHCSDAAVGFTAVAGPELPEHLENFVVPRLGLYDMDAFTLDNNKPLTQKQKEKGEVQLPLLDDQRLAIANKLDGITVQQLLTINWAFHSLQSVIFRLEHGRPAPCLIASAHTVKFITGEDINHYGFLFESRTNIMWLINHGQSILDGAQQGWNDTHKQGINSAVSGFWSAVMQRPGLFDATQFASNFPLDKKAKLEEFKKAWAAMVKGAATPEQENIIKDSKSWLVHKGWEYAHQHNGDLSGLPADIRDYFEDCQSWRVSEAFKELDSHGGIISKVSEERRAVLVKNPFYKIMDKALTENAKTIEQMKEDRSNYVLVGKENVFHIPASKKTVYKYVWTLRHLAKDNWKRLKFEQAAGISLFEMEKAYSQLRMAKQPCATSKQIDKLLEQEALAEKNSSAQKTQEEVVDKSDRPAKRQKNATVKKCVKCGMEKKRWSYLIEEWDKLEDNERVCQVCTKAEKEGKQIARFDPAVRRELDQAVRRLEVQSRLSAHKQMEQLERVAISVVRPSKEVELGLGVGKRDDRMTVTSIAPGIFDGSQLEIGMIIDSVNGSCPLSFKDALHTLQNAEGRINIAALST